VDQVKEEVKKKEEISVEVPLEVVVQMKISEFDKNIAESEAKTANLKKDKMVFLHDQNINFVRQKYEKKEDGTALKEATPQN